MLVKTFAGAVHGVDAQTITIEVNTGGLIAAQQPEKPSFYIVGLPDSAVREGYSRIEAALKNSRWHIPRLKTIINLLLICP
jgi:magnesium chelatase family protein